MSTEKAFSQSEKALIKVANSIVERMEELRGSNFEKPWFNVNYHGLPQNLSGRPYHGMNTLILNFHATHAKHEFPVYVTFNQANKEGLRINKGAVSTPILYYEPIYKDEQGKVVSDIQDLPKEEVEKLKKSFFLKQFNVFNIGDTDYKEKKPELYEQFKKQFEVPELKDEKGMYANKELDRMFTKQEWLCPIEIKQSDSAYYQPTADKITVPLKAQFNKGGSEEEIYKAGQSFYSTALHEMAHSTGIESRLGREKGQRFGDPKYAKEELVAELTAALIGNNLGFSSKITDENAKYLNSWVGALRQEPRFLLSVLGEANKASDMIMSEISVQKEALRKETLYNKEDNPQVKKENTSHAKSMYELEAQFSRINALYPASVDNEAKRQIVKHIKDASDIISKYHQNIEKHYGYDWTFAPQNAHTPIPKEVYAGAGELGKDIVGTLTWKDTGETRYYSNKESYLARIKEELDYNPTGVKYQILSKDPILLKFVDDLRYGGAGLENPKDVSDYIQKNPKVSDTSLVKMRQGDFAVRGKIDGIDTGLLPIAKADAVKLLSLSDTHKKEELLSSLVLSNAKSEGQGKQQEINLFHKR